MALASRSLQPGRPLHRKLLSASRIVGDCPIYLADGLVPEHALFSYCFRGLMLLEVCRPHSLELVSQPCHFTTVRPDQTTVGRIGLLPRERVVIHGIRWYRVGNLILPRSGTFVLPIRPTSFFNWRMRLQVLMQAE